MSKGKVLNFLLVLVLAVLGWTYFNFFPKAPKEKINLTIEELKKFDGKEGRPTYVAINGNIYDLSRCRHWKRGSHPKSNVETLAGRDLTEILNGSKHGIKYLKHYPIIGRVVESQY